VASSATLRKRQHDIEAFVDALNRFLAVMEPEQASLTGAPRWIPRAGEEAEAARLRFEVDHAAGRAAYALAEAGVFVDWKPRGTFQTQPVSPAQAWATILDWDPMFGVEVILACCSQALGILSMQAEAAEEDESHPVRQVAARAPRITGRHLVPVAKWVGGVAGALVIAFLTYWLGWS
jgi:hypothetical protein